MELSSKLYVFLICSIVLTFIQTTNTQKIGIVGGPVDILESWQGRVFDLIQTYIDWCNNSWWMNELDVELDSVFANHSSILITWQPYGCDHSTTPTNVDVLIANGGWDSYIQAWGAMLNTKLLQNTSKSVYLRLAHEMNGNWYPWSANAEQGPADYINMWKHTRQVMSTIITNPSQVIWLWCPNNQDIGSYKAEQYFPGNQYIDYVGVDGYNDGASQTWSKWSPPSQVYDNMIGRINTLTSGSKPMTIPEFGTVAQTQKGNDNVQAKNQWLEETISYFVSNKVVMFAYFNIPCPTEDYPFFGGTVLGDVNYTFNGNVYYAYSGWYNAVHNLTISV